MFTDGFETAHATGFQGSLVEAQNIEELHCKNAVSWTKATLHLIVPDPVIEYTPNVESVQVMEAVAEIKTIANKGYLGCNIPSLVRWVKYERREYYCHMMLDTKGINSFFDSLMDLPLKLAEIAYLLASATKDDKALIASGTDFSRDLAFREALIYPCLSLILFFLYGNFMQRNFIMAIKAFI